MIPQPAVNAAFGRGPQDLAHPQIVFYYDIACPYVYLAVPQLLALADRAGAVIDWRPVSLEELLRGAAEHWRAVVAHENAARVQKALRRTLYDKNEDCRGKNHRTVSLVSQAGRAASDSPFPSMRVSFPVNSRGDGPI